MSRKAVVLVIVIVAVLSSGVLAHAASRATVDSLQTDATAHDLFASFVVKGAFDDHLKEQLSAGLPLEFVHSVEVARRRLLWFDKVLARKTITTTVTYDTLTRQYSLSKKVNDEVAETSVAINQAEVERWMTHIDRVRLADPTHLNDGEEGDLYVRVRSMLRKRFVMLFVPWDVQTGWERVMLSLPAEVTRSAR
ncbi:MAG: DUF4390 domain-containing protein [Candidatus Polarisedimenticolia bacterium]